MTAALKHDVTEPDMLTAMLPQAGTNDSLMTATKADISEPEMQVQGEGTKRLVGLDKQEMQQLMQDLGEKPFRAKQLWHWVYWQGAKTLDEMTSLPKSLKQTLADEGYHVGRPAEVTAQVSEDGTRKWLLGHAYGHKAETVYIPEEDRGAVCISSQVGCTLTCDFCHTGTQKLVRNLTAGEIVSQFMIVRDALNEWPTPTDGQSRLVSNIVMMGMGEPLFNYDNVAKALKIIMDGEGLSLSKRRITLSTSGVVPKMRQCGEELGVNLALSLHAVTDELRNLLVPLNKKYPLAEVLAACREYGAANNARRITMEYVMLKGVNDSDADAREMVRLLKGIPAKVNLIPFNPWPGSKYECSSANRIRQFAMILNDHGLSAPVRTPRGRDILAACGQLKSDSERKQGERVRLS